MSLWLIGKPTNSPIWNCSAVASIARKPLPDLVFRESGGASTAEFRMNGHAWYELGMAYHTLNRRDKLEEVTAHLNRFDPTMALQLTRATEIAASAQLPVKLNATTAGAAPGLQPCSNWWSS